MGNKLNLRRKKKGWRKKNMLAISKNKRKQTEFSEDKENSQISVVPISTSEKNGGQNKTETVNETSCSNLNCNESGVKVLHELKIVQMPKALENDGYNINDSQNASLLNYNTDGENFKINDMQSAQTLEDNDYIIDDNQNDYDIELINNNADGESLIKINDMQSTQTGNETNCTNLNSDESGANILHEMENLEQMQITLENNDSQNAPDDDNNWYEISYSTEETISYNLDGRRIIDLNYFFEKLKSINDHNKAFGCTLSNIEILCEKRQGLLTKLKLKCNMCNKSFIIDSEPKTKLDLNQAAVSGIISAGIGYAQFNEVCASMDVPSFSQKHYDKVQNNIYEDWRNTALVVMEAAAKKERDAAIADGHVNKDGIPYIDVIVDGAWCKRSFNTNFSALSGTAAIIGKRFGEVLFIGVKNKYCCICARAENKNAIPGDHACYKNYSGSSTSMESEILLEGFRQSIPMHGIIYKRMIADGDSSTYSKILEGRPYSDCSVEKIECKNHIFRNMCKKLKNITTETKYPANLRKKITTQRILAIRKVICSSIAEHVTNNLDFDTKVNHLFKDITNSYNHAFGNHDNCQPYYCSSEKNSEDLTLTLKTCSIWHRIRYIVNTVAAKARSLMHNSDSNRVESFNSVIAKFVGGKRINYSSRSGYQSRCSAAVVSFNTKHPLSTLHKYISGRSPKTRVKKYEENKLKQRNITFKSKQKVKKRIFKENKPNDKDYGQNCQKPDMTTTEFNKCKDIFLKDLPSTEEERRQIERSTILQRDSSEWLELRRKLLTASNFAKVVNRRSQTSVKKIVKNLVYQKDISHVPSIKHGIDNEANALEQLAAQLNIKVEPCGLFIDKSLPFLGATPDGIVGEESIVEIKCPITAFKTSINEAIEKRKVTFWKKTKNGYEVNKKHPWFIQIQGQLHITERQQCIFAVWSGKNEPLKIEVVQRDDQFWSEIMEQKLKDFYFKCMLPELCDPRHVRNMPIRELDETTHFSC